MNTQLRLVILSRDFFPDPGGRATELTTTSRALQEQGVEVHVLTLQKPGLRPLEQVGGVSVHRLPGPGPRILRSSIFAVASLALIGRLRPDIIHANELLLPTTVAITARRMFSVPVVVTEGTPGPGIGGVDRLRNSSISRLRIEAIRRSVDSFICISGQMEEELEQIGIDIRRRVRIPYGIDVRRFSPASEAEKQFLRHKLGLHPVPAPVVIFTGRLSPEKRVTDLLQVWSKISVSCPDATLLIVGDGPLLESLQSVDAQNVSFLGAIGDVVPLLQTADLFVLPSSSEGLSIAMLEALASGLPAVVTNVGGAGEVIRDKWNGLLVPPGDLEALRKAVERLLGDPALRKSIGQQARETAVREYSIESIASRLKAHYFKIVDQAGRNGRASLRRLSG